MSRYLNTIIRHNFRDHADLEKVRAFVLETASKIANAYGYTFNEEIRADIEPGYVSFEFTNELFDEITVMEFHLYEDFWLLDSSFDYWQLGDDKDCGDFWLRDDNRFIAKTLGQYELWFCEDSLGYNGGEINYPGTTLEQWLNDTCIRTGTEIPDIDTLDREDFPGEDIGDECLSEHCIFHDKFEQGDALK